MDSFTDLPRFCPDATTMALFEREPRELWEACDVWLEYIRQVWDKPPFFDYAVDALTESLQLWASFVR
jgi:hypothetical protein